MSVFQRGKKFYVDYYYAGYRIRKGGFLKKTDAQKFLVKCKNDALYRKHPMPRSKTVTFNELANKYISEYSKLHKAPKSFRTDISLTKSLLSFFDGFLLRDINLEAVDRYKGERVNAPCRRGGTMSKITVNREVGLLRNMLSKALAWQMIDANPILNVQMFKEEPRERILTMTELQTVIDNAQPLLRDIVVAALNTGMRRGELLNLKWTHVNLEEGIIIVEKTKTNKIRHIPLNAVMKELLSQRCLDRAGSEYVFRNPRTGRPIVDIKSGWKTLLRNCGIENFRFHDLRHCFASYALAHGGGNLSDLKEVLGHEKITTTSRYVKSMLEGKQKLVDGFQIGARSNKKRNNKTA